MFCAAGNVTFFAFRTMFGLAKKNLNTCSTYVCVGKAFLSSLDMGATWG